MAKVTALKVQARNKNRVNVSLDGEFAFGLVKIEAARLRLGQELSEADVARLKATDTTEMVYDKALTLLNSRPRSEAEIRQRLLRKGIAKEQIAAALERLRRAGLVDDAGFARYWVENRATFRPKGKRALRAEMRAKGLPAKEIDRALADADDAAAAAKLAAARAPRLKGLPLPEFKRKLGSYLARRGIDYETISEAVERAWRELDTGGGVEQNSEMESED